MHQSCKLIITSLRSCQKPMNWPGANLPLSAADQLPSVAKFGLKSLWMSCCTPPANSILHPVPFLKVEQPQNKSQFFFSLQICLSVFDKLIWIAYHLVMEILLTAHLNDLLNVTFLQCRQKTVEQLDGLPTGKLPEMWIYCFWWKHKTHCCNFKKKNHKEQ